jgi:hypothetical protein
MAIQKPMIVKPIFIVGAMRSGTTLLAEMLSRSVHIAHCPFELKDVWSQVGGVPMASPKTRDFQCPECSANDLWAGQREALTERFLQRIAACDGKVAGATFLNKNPHLSNKLPLVEALFPDARFVWIFRDLPQVVTSVRRLFTDVCQRRETWHWWPYPSETTRNRCWNAFYSVDSRPDISPDRIFPGGDVRFIAEYWLECNRAISGFVKRLPPACQMELDEEAMLIDPGKELAVLAAKLEIPSIDCDLVRDTVDLSRNDQWRDLLDENELEVLTDYVRAQAEEIDEILPEGRHASRQLAMLRSVANR